MIYRNITISILSIFISACSVKNVSVNNSIKEANTINNKSELNKGALNKIDNKYEINQIFNKQNTNNEYVSENYNLEIKDPQFVMLSAFCLDTGGEYNLYYRVNNDGVAGEWKQIPLNNEVNNPERKVFSGVNILSDIENIQFKSTHSTNSEVVFRLFIAE